MASFIPRQSSVNEIISDSEPERIEYRASQSARKSKPVVNYGEVIELTDSEGDAGSSSLPLQASKSCNNSRENTTLRRTESPPPAQLSMAAIRQLSFKDTQSKASRINAKGKAPATRVDEVGEPVKPTAPKRRPKSKFTNPFPLDLIAKVNRCVCCEAAWTARKSAEHKASHIEDCARQRDFQHDTIMILLQSEADSPQPTKYTKKQTTLSIPSTKHVPTLLNEVSTSLSKKKQKQAVAPVLIAPGPASRERILQRAIHILPPPLEKPLSDVDVLPTTLPLRQDGSISFLSDDEREVQVLVVEDDSPNLSTRTSLEDCSTPLELFESLAIVSPPVTPRRRGRPRKLSDAGSPSAVRTSPIRARKTPSKSQALVEPQESWSARMKAVVQNDVELYLRVLRYEPMTMSEWMKIAEAHAPHPKLKDCLKTFLDDQGIVYNAESQWGKKKKAKKKTP